MNGRDERNKLQRTRLNLTFLFKFNLFGLNSPPLGGESWLKTSRLKSAANTPLLAAGCFITHSIQTAVFYCVALINAGDILVTFFRKEKKHLEFLVSKCLFLWVAGAGFEPTTFGL